MRKEHGKLKGPLVVSDDLQLHGMVAGDVTVARGGFLLLHGMVTGDLIVADGARADVRGTVSGSLLNDGTVEVHGVVGGRVTSTAEASTTVAPGAVINGVVH